MTYLTLAEVRRANKRIGHHWFSPDTMRFFNTVLETDTVYGGRWFISGERMELDMPLLYTIRSVDETGRIDTVGVFQAYDSYVAAEKDVLMLEAGVVTESDLLPTSIIVGDLE